MKTIVGQKITSALSLLIYTRSSVRGISIAVVYDVKIAKRVETCAFKSASQELSYASYFIFLGCVYNF